MNSKRARLLIPLLVFCTSTLALPTAIYAHCDTLDGPVVKAARIALETSDLTPVLKWVKSEYEQEVRRAFQYSLAVREQGSEARQLADQYFFETVVRVHRLGEGAPYTGLKPAGTDLGVAIPAADAALESASIERVFELLTREMDAGLRERFHQVVEKRKHAEESVAMGRDFVEAYVEYVHYVERLHQAITTHAGHQTTATTVEHEH